jgi:hypothetical protein
MPNLPAGKPRLGKVGSQRVRDWVENPKAEIRDPKEIRSSKSETPAGLPSALGIPDSDLYVMEIALRFVSPDYFLLRGGCSQP